MGYTAKRLAPGFEALCAAVQVSSLAFLSMSAADASKGVIDVLEKVSKLPDDEWAALPPEAQKLFDAAAERTNSNQDPTSLVIEIVKQDEEKKSEAAHDKKEVDPAPEHKKGVSKATSASGETKTVTPAIKGRPGGGGRRNPATDWCRNYCIDHSDAKAGEVLEECLKQNFPIPISRGTVDAIVFEVGNVMRLLRERGSLK